jgi:hypothetical protein
VIGKTPSKNVNDVDDLGDFPGEDTYRLISIPANDPFDISKNYFQTTETREVAEIYASYPFLYTRHFHQTNKDDVQSQEGVAKKAKVNAILRESASKGAKSFAKNLLVVLPAKKQE